MWRAEASEGNETAKVHNRIAPYIYGHGVDLGCGCWKLKVEKSKEYSCLGVDGGFSPMALKEADVIADVSNLTMFTDGAFDYVFSSHTLEDMHYPQAVLREWWRILRPGGNLILYLPLTRNAAREMGREDWSDFYPNMGDPGANINHQQDFAPRDIIKMVGAVGDAELVLDEVRGDKDEYSFLLIFRKMSSGSIPLRGYPMIECLCEYHRRYSNEKNESMVRGNGEAEQGISAEGQEESMVQDRATMVQESRRAAS